MSKRNRFLSLELLLAILFIAAFFLPWLDMWGVKVVGWDIPDLQKKMTKVTNFFKFFSKNKEWIYSTHIVYIIPILSSLVILTWLFLRKKVSQVLLLITGVFSVVVVVNLFMKLPKAGNGVYLLAVTSVLAVIYSIIVLRRKKEIVQEEVDIIEDVELQTENVIDRQVEEDVLK